MAQHYSNPKRASVEHALPDIEVFYHDEASTDPLYYFDKEDTACVRESGWYWWPCFPGCLPDSNPTGPFATEAEALADARQYNDDCDEE